MVTLILRLVSPDFGTCSYQCIIIIIISIVIIIIIIIPVINMLYSTVFFTLYVGLCMVKIYFIIISLCISFPTDENYEIVVPLDREI